MRSGTIERIIRNPTGYAGPLIGRAGAAIVKADGSRTQDRTFVRFPPLLPENGA